MTSVCHMGLSRILDHHYRVYIKICIKSKSYIILLSNISARRSLVPVQLNVWEPSLTLKTHERRVMPPSKKNHAFCSGIVLAAR